MTEILLLAAIGGSLGLLLSSWGSEVLLVMGGTQGQQIDIDVSPDARLLAFNTLVSLSAVILFGLAPALSVSRADVNAELKQTPDARPHMRLSPILVVAQVALSLLLIAGAALFLQMLHNLRTRDLGFDAETLVQVRTQPEASGYTREQIPGLARRIVERLRTTPGVLAVSVAHSGFATGTSSTCCIAIPGRMCASDRERAVRMIGVGPGYFATVGQRLRLGRDFAPQDASADPLNPSVAIVNDGFVRQFSEMATRVYATSNILDTITTRTSNDTSEAYAGDFNELLIGMRTSFTTRSVTAGGRLDKPGLPQFAGVDSRVSALRHRSRAGQLVCGAAIANEYVKDPRATLVVSPDNQSRQDLNDVIQSIVAGDGSESERVVNTLGNRV